MQKIFFSIAMLFTCLVFSCRDHPVQKVAPPAAMDTSPAKQISGSGRTHIIIQHFINAAHHSAAVPGGNGVFISDVPAKKNIERPSKTYILEPKYKVDDLFGVWGTKDAPVSDFRVDAEIFDVADYEGNGSMPYILYKDSLFIFYNDFIRQGRIIYSTKDSLVIRWKMDEKNTDQSYSRWK